MYIIPFIILNDGVSATPELEQELLDHCRNGLARFKFPRWFSFVSELPKTATGKIQRFKLRGKNQSTFGQ